MSVAIKAYYDSSSSKGHLGARDRLTLAGYAATPVCWSEFERRWNRVLAGDGKRPSCRYLHMTDLQAFRGEFARKQGWDEEARKSLLCDLNNHCLSPLSRVEYEGQFVGAVCTVELGDYHKACATLPDLRKRRPEQICLDYVLHVAVDMIPADPAGESGHAGTAELFFDRNEAFFRYVDRLWRKPFNKRPPLLRSVSALDQVDMTTAPPMQAADFLAWATNRDFTSKDKFFNVMRCLAAPAAGIRLDYRTFVEQYKR